MLGFNIMHMTRVYYYYSKICLYTYVNDYIWMLINTYCCWYFFLWNCMCIVDFTTKKKRKEKKTCIQEVFREWCKCTRFLNLSERCTPWALWQIITTHNWKWRTNSWVGKWKHHRPQQSVLKSICALTEGNYTSGWHLENLNRGNYTLP